LAFALVIFSNLINLQVPVDSNINQVATNAETNRFLTKDDIVLQQWININLSNNSVILFSPIDGGFDLIYLLSKSQYIGSYGDITTLLFSSQRFSEYDQSQTREYFASYIQLLIHLSQNPDSSETLRMLRFFNISYIYIGAFQNLKASASLATKLNSLGIKDFNFSGLSAQLLNDSLNYRSIKNVGNASLIKVEYDSFLKTWEEDSFSSGWSVANYMGNNVNYIWNASGSFATLTVGGGHADNRVWIKKTITPINLSQFNDLILDVNGTFNAKFLVAGLDSEGKTIIGSSDWENAPSDQTLKSYKSDNGTVTSIVIGVLSVDGNVASIDINSVAFGSKKG
jgi:hypothetical protein